MKKSTLFLFCMAIAVAVSAQKTIAVQSNGTASFYTDWAKAWQNTQAGDTIYLPGGTYNTGNIDIDKPVTIIGVGHDTASIHDRLFSHLNGNIRLLKGSDGTSLHGFQFVNLYIGTNATNDSVTNISITRCKLTQTLILGYKNPSPANQITIDESVISSVDGKNAKHVTFTKNIIHGNLSNFDGNVTFLNNILVRDYYTLYTINSVLFRNNFFRYGAYPIYSNSQNNLFQNNIFVANLNIHPQTDLNIWENNIFNQPINEVFVGFETGDYHLKAGSVGIAAGTDGYDIGIYGTAVPYKEGGVPFTPRIIQDSVSKQTDEEGKINIKVQVEAQTR